ncbi:MAG: 16S rRNA (uracil(1498)-N(3))-methyltransferase [Sneathiella sp.]|jgi:16S rRNA (uracil1498-N3)-methyltransferase|uniref:16S rRNA (uracil(1498)-N(3))-methyltransferase n=1 Tax=Sneathiella sp. TaxID=1964365 RepID=UPI000C49BF62|nr:16S rRNA (uracil(1498)-N(3))-methyltransferase [Sneathiella sp.]MAL78638.1 16S rRNA (uracil(1498)-N(3))-methyltransferase [Sneathiella sp.]|tara:strand:- start:225 stop:968 length:744 start_codon:yes stop_codon:yes gene_type:complete
MFPKPYSLRLFVPSDLGRDVGVVLDKSQSHYVANVMRKSAGERIALFNGRDGEWIGTLQEVHKNHCLVHVTEQLRPQIDEPDISLLFAPVKKIQTALIVQKATELGVANLQPVQTARTNAERLREDKMELQVLEASEQCERLNIPIVGELMPLQQALEALEPERVLLFCNERLTGNGAGDVIPALAAAQKWAIVTGPEGGFADEEIAMIAARPNTHAISLGPRILRAETAVIAALALLQAFHGDWTS